MNDATISLIVTVGSALIGLIIRYALKSKCSHFILCCGVLEVNRDIENEVKEELQIGIDNV